MNIVHVGERVDGGQPLKRERSVSYAARAAGWMLAQLALAKIQEATGLMVVRREMDSQFTSFGKTRIAVGALQKHHRIVWISEIVVVHDDKLMKSH